MSPRIDLSRLLAARTAHVRPFCAEVIKVERPCSGDNALLGPAVRRREAPTTVCQPASAVPTRSPRDTARARPGAVHRRGSVSRPQGRGRRATGGLRACARAHPAFGTARTPVLAPTASLARAMTSCPCRARADVDHGPAEGPPYRPVWRRGRAGVTAPAVAIVAADGWRGRDRGALLVRPRGPGNVAQNAFTCRAPERPETPIPTSSLQDVETAPDQARSACEDCLFGASAIVPLAGGWRATSASPPTPDRE